MFIKYRPEIDGLRAVAVTAVILYHAKLTFHGASFFKGGFIGVDIFFVISGYLIASILLKELHEGSFSFLRFYERRIRRILPALFTVMFCSLPFAWKYMPPTEMEAYLRSVLYSLFSISNFWFAGEDHYAAVASARRRTCGCSYLFGANT